MGNVSSSWDLPGATDLLSNATRIVPQPDEDPRPWLGDVASGNGHLLTFVHEATHNWCFTSAVVHAQLHLAARAEINAITLVALGDSPVNQGGTSKSDMLGAYSELLRSIAGDPRSRIGDVQAARDILKSELIDDVVRLEWVQALLRPLAEGLALFAEYDALPGPKSKTWSPLPTAVAWNFSGIDMLRQRAAGGLLRGPSDIDAITRELMAKARISPQALNAKASVLARPLGSAADGYLPGYLTVKSLWHHLCRQDSRLYTETDLVLTYLKAFFFDDHGFAAEMLAPPQEDHVKSANVMTGTFWSRMRDFGRVTGTDVAAFEDYLASRSDDDEPSSHTPGLLYTKDEDKRARDYIKEAIDAYSGSSLPALIYGFGTRATLTLLNNILQQRPYLITCSVPVAIDPHPESGGINVSWRGNPVLSVPQEDLQPSASPSGRLNVSEEPNPELKLDILLGTFGAATLSRAAVVSRGEQVVSCTVWGPPSGRNAIRQQVIEGFASRDKRILGSHAFQATSELVVEEDPQLRSTRDHVREYRNEVVDSIYQPEALGFARTSEAIDHCAELMADKGMYALLGSADMVKRAALLGLLASINRHRDSIDNVFRHLHSYDLQDTLHQLSLCWDRYGFPPPVIETTNGEDAWLYPLI
jgi:hypothetical protein